MILLEKPLHLLVLILKAKNTGFILLTLIICGLILHSWLFIEIQVSGGVLNKFTLVKVNKNTNPVKKLFNKPKHFILSHF